MTKKKDFELENTCSDVGRLNKRQESRIKCNKPVEVIMSDKTRLAMTALNYSMRGVGVTGSIFQVIPYIGEQVKVSFTLEANDPRQVCITGYVKYIKFDGGVYYLGLGV
ncbi:PilZ domain-containing protein [Beggiatoa alba]|nr:PilZ domain-containing protein [Beggiatoa alba]